MAPCSWELLPAIRSPCGGQTVDVEAYPTSPFILEPFRYDNLLIPPPPLAPVAALNPPCAYGMGQQASDAQALSTHCLLYTSPSPRDA